MGKLQFWYKSHLKIPNLKYLIVFQKILPEMILTCTFENGGEMNHRNAP